MKLYNLYKYKIFLYLLICTLSFSNISNSSERLDNLWKSYYFCPNFNKCLDLINKIEKELELPEFVDKYDELDWLNYEKGSLLMSSLNDDDILIAEKYLLKIINNERLIKNPNELYYYAHVNLGWSYHTEKIIFNPKKAIKFMKVGAEQKIPVAINNLGAFYEMGLGDKRNYKKAFELYSEASKLGQHWAHSNIGKFYILGWGGAEKNYYKAINHLKLSTISNYGTNDNYILKLLFSKKRLPKNHKEFVKWLEEEVLIHKDPNSFLRLGYEYDYKKESIFWYYLCSKYSKIIDDVKRCNQEIEIVKIVLDKEIDTNQINLIKKKADEWYKKNIK